MGYYNNIIGQGLANKLAAAGMELKPLPPTFDYELNYDAPTYADAFDWVAEKGLFIEILPTMDGRWRVEAYTERAVLSILIMAQNTWLDAANAAIERAIEIIKSPKK